MRNYKKELRILGSEDYSYAEEKPKRKEPPKTCTVRVQFSDGVIKSIPGHYETVTTFGAGIQTSRLVATPDPLDGFTFLPLLSLRATWRAVRA